MEISGNKSENLEFQDRNLLQDAMLAVTAINQDVVLLNYGHVLIQRDYQKLEKVRLLSGGTAGTELAHALLVGKGMLTAAVFGEDCAPSSRLILRTIKELNQGENYGIFVLVQSNSDAFNFALAVDRANADCYTRVRLLMVDDIRFACSRNSCGFILLAKILGAMAENNAVFDDICKCYKSVVDELVTVPLCCSHEALSVNDLEPVLLSALQREPLALPSKPLTILINTSRSLDKLGELSLVKQIIEKIKQMGLSVVRVYYGNFVFVCEENLSAALTILKNCDSKIVDYLDAPCSASGWLQVTQFLPEITVENSRTGLLKHMGKEEILLSGPQLTDFQVNVMKRSLQFACDALISCERQLNIIDEELSLGNVGTRLKNMATAVNKKVDNNKLPLHCPYGLLKKLGIITDYAIGGTLGAVYGIFFENAAKVFKDMRAEELHEFSWLNALSAGIEAMQIYSNYKVETTSMYSPLKYCELAIKKAMGEGLNVFECYHAGVTVAEDAARRTQLSVNKYPDVGAHAVGIWIRAVYESVKLMTVD